MLAGGQLLLIIMELLIDLPISSVESLLPGLIAYSLVLSSILLRWKRGWSENLLILAMLFVVQFFFFRTPESFHVMVYWMALIPVITLVIGGVTKSIVVLVLVGLFYAIDVFYGSKRVGLDYTSTNNFVSFAVAGVLYVTFSMTMLYLLYNQLGNAYAKIKSRKNRIQQLSTQLYQTNALLESELKQRAREIISHQDKLREASAKNSHLTRAPVARLLGLLELFDPDKDEEIKLLMPLIKKTVKDLDNVIYEVNKTLNKEDEEVT